MLIISSILFTPVVVAGLLCTVVLLYISLHKKAHDKKRARQRVVFADIVWKNKLEISEEETLNDHLLAIDRMNFIFLYIDFSCAKEKIVLVDLWKIKEVSMTVDVKALSNGMHDKPGGVGPQRGKVVLTLTLPVPQPAVQMVLLDHKTPIHDHDRIITRAAHWQQLIGTCLQELSPAMNDL